MTRWQEKVSDEDYSVKKNRAPAMTLANLGTLFFGVGKCKTDQTNLKQTNIKWS
tara:strand:+ start:340 stop:501 length:162 start_codon:yes stop_codon:yes gene_type:complete